MAFPPVALPPVAVEVELDLPPVAEEVEPEFDVELAPLVDDEFELLLLLLVFVFALLFPPVDGVEGGTTLHTYNWPLNIASCPSPSPNVPVVPAGTRTRSASGLLQFHACAGLHSVAKAKITAAITAFI